MEEDYIISFLGEGGRKVERRVKKKQVTTESLAQIFHTAGYCNWADIFQVFSRGMQVTIMEELERLMMSEL